MDARWGFLILKCFCLSLDFWAVLNTYLELIMYSSLASTHGNPPASNFPCARMIDVNVVTKNNLEIVTTIRANVYML